jgi:signal transduction histidine kinase
LGTLEFRANRLLSVYAFISLYGTAFFFVFSLLGRWLRLSTNAILAYLVCSAFFVAIALALRQRFVRIIDRLAYGAEHSPDELIRAFANRIPQAVTRDDLVTLLAREIMPSLLIRQSALIVIPSDLPRGSAGVTVDAVYVENAAMPPSWPASALHDLLAAAGRYRPYERRAPHPTLDWPRLAITFSVGKGARGIWLLGERHPDDFYPQKDIDLLTTLGNQVGVTLYTAGLLLESRRFAQDLKALHVVSSMVASTLQPQEVYRRTVETLAQVFGYRFVSIYRVEDERLHLQSQVGYDPATLIWDLPLTTGVMARAVRTRKAQLVPDASMDVDFQRELPTLVSEVAVPVQNAEQVLGVINVESAVPGQLTINDLDLLLILANQLAIAITNASLFDTVTRQLHQLEALRQVELALTSNLNLDQLLRTIVAQAITLVDAQGAGLYIYLPDSDQLELRVSQQPPSWQHDYTGARLRRDEGLAGAVLTRNETIMTNDYHAGFSTEAFAEIALSSVLGVPLTWGSEILGVLTIYNTEAGRVFNPDDQRVAGLLSGQVAVAIVNARLYEDARARAEKLAVAYDDLKQLDRLKDEFVQTVSHELRTPLTFVCGYVDLLLENALGDLSAPQREALTIVADRAAAMVHLVNDIINLQQMDLRSSVHGPVDLGRLAEACAQGARVTAQRNGIGVEVKIAPDLPQVSGDSNRLGEVLDNLLDNAIKFSPNGGVITIRVEQTQAHFRDTDQQPQAGVKVTVTDTGIGIAEDQLSRIWDRFYQVDGTKTRRFGGAGLGLAIVKRIIEAHGGLIGVESQSGAGSSFWFMLPVWRPANGPHPDEVHPAG